jgi:uncharacterized repeat protein (TIGR01451 family)
LTFAGALVLALVLAPAVLADNPPAPQPTGDSAQSLIDGCQRDAAALIAAQTPEWAYVYNTPPDQPPPPPRWVSGIADSHNHAFQSVHTSGADFAFGHDAMDFNMNVREDSGFDYLLAGTGPVGAAGATGNYAGNGEESGRLHTEWEDLTIPRFAWPEPGDRVTELGSWVWDCGHWGTPTNIFSPDYDLPQEGQPCPSPFAGDPSQCTITGEHTEFHPYRALFDQKAQSPNSPYAENEAELLVSTDKTRAGKTEDCAHKFPPLPSPVLPNPAAYPPDFAACVETEPNWQDVSGDYSFLVPAPAKPTADARLSFHAVDEGSVGAPAPTLAQEGDAVRITFHLDSVPNERLVVAYRIFVGWDTVLASDVPTHLRVSFDRLDIHRAMDPGCSLGNQVPGCQLESTRSNQGTTAPGDWNIYWDVNGIWGQWPPGELLVNDGDVLSGSQSVDLYVPPGKGWRLFVHGRECDGNGVDPARPLLDCPTNQELADNNDVQGLIEDTYASADASLGTHSSDGRTKRDDPTSTCPDGNPDGCYSLTYTVSKIDDAASRIRLPDLAVSQTDSPDPVTVGQQLTYSVTVTNTGPATAGGVTLTDVLPAGVSFSSATPSQGSCTQSSGTVTCGLGTFGSGDTATVDIKVRPQSDGTITNTASVTSNEPDAVPTNDTSTESTTVVSPFPRPGAASPLRVPLVPEFRACTAPNRTHVAPLSSPSCTPPRLTSPLLTTSSIGSGGAFARYDVIPGNPATPANEADINIVALATDVRRSSDGSDYAGKGILTTTMRITDIASGAAGGEPATVQDNQFSVPIDCLSTSSSALGGACNVSTTANALVPGSVMEGKRTVISAFSVALEDAGPDGSVAPSPDPLGLGCPPTCGSGDEAVFLRQGVFAP